MPANRISHAIDPKDLADFIDHLKQSQAIAKKIIANTNKKDSQTGQAMGSEGGWQYAGKAFNVLAAHREIFTPLDMNFEEYQKDYLLAQTLLETMMVEVDQLDSMLNMALQLTGRDLMEASNKVRNRLQELGEHYPNYQVLFEEVNFFYENRGVKKNNKEGEAPKQGN